VTSRQSRIVLRKFDQIAARALNEQIAFTVVGDGLVAIAVPSPVNFGAGLTLA